MAERPLTVAAEGAVSRLFRSGKRLSNVVDRDESFSVIAALAPA
jgi:hypothetical protein